MSQPRFGSPSDSGRKYRDAALAGVGLTAASGGVYAYGRGMRQQGRAAFEQGMARANAGQARLGAVELGPRDLRYDGKPDGRKKAGREIRAAQGEIGAGRLQRKTGQALTRGSKLPRRVGLAGLAAGLGLTGAGLVGNEVARSRALRPKKSNVTDINEYRSRSAKVSGGLLQDAAGNRVPLPGRMVKPAQRAYLERTGLIDSTATDDEAYEALRRGRAGGR